jgi:hypothetical protein
MYRVSNPAFGHVDPEFELSLNKALGCRHHPLAGSLTLSQDGKLSSPEESHPEALRGKVENWRGALWVRFQFPPRQTQHADFPHYAFSVSFI